MRNTLYLVEVGLKYLPRGSLEVCSPKRSKILMDYGMIGPLGLPALIFFVVFIGFYTILSGSRLSGPFLLGLRIG